jgi:hypothetical protein
LPAIYPYRFFATSGGLLSYGIRCCYSQLGIRGGSCWMTAAKASCTACRDFEIIAEPRGRPADCNYLLLCSDIAGADGESKKRSNERAPEVHQMSPIRLACAVVVLVDGLVTAP